MGIEEYKTRKGGNSVRQSPYRKEGETTLLHRKDEGGFVTYSCTVKNCPFASTDRKKAREHYQKHFYKLI